MAPSRPARRLMVARVLALTVALAAAAAPGRAQDSQDVARAQNFARQAAPIWTYADQRMRHAASGMGFPLQAGELHFTALNVASHPGTGLDDAVQWRSADGQSFMTAFIFRPTMADAGLIGAMVDLAIRDRFGATLTVVAEERAAGGVPAAMHVARYRGGALNGKPVWTGAALVRNGPWLVVLRVTGPGDQQAALESALDTAAAGLDFGAAYHPRPYHRLALESCPARTDETRANQLPMVPATAAAYAIVLAGAEAGSVKVEGNIDRERMSRVPDRFCATVLDSGPGRRHWLLRPAPGSTGTLPLTEMGALLLINDAGKLVEVSRAISGKTPWFLVSHDVGEGRLAAAFDAVPSNDQFAAVLSDGFPAPDANAVGFSIDAQGQVKVNVPGMAKKPDTVASAR